VCHQSLRSRARRPGSRVALIGAALLLGSPAVLAADAPDLLNDTFQLSLGAFGLNNEPRVDLKGSTGGGGQLDLGRELSGDEFAGRLDAQWRFADRHKVRLAAFTYSRDKSRVVDEEFEWGDETFPVDARIELDNGWQVIELVYDYSFLRRENYEVGATIGVHYFDFELDVKARGDASGQEFDRVLKESASVGLPAPVIGLRGLWALPRNFWIDVAAQFFALSLDDYDGSLLDYRLAVTWQPKPWLGIGVGYNRFDVDLDIDKDNFNGNLDWVYDGPMVFYSASF
jgi:hypothetical protein